MEPLTFAEISTQALIDSINRYRGYINNTKSFEWTSCSRCEEVAKKTHTDTQYSKACHLCPLFQDSWCRAYPTASRLHPRWHDANDFLHDGTSSKRRWMNDMENYVGLLTRIVNSREKPINVDDCVIDSVIAAELTIRIHMLTEMVEGTRSSEMTEFTSKIEDVRDWEKIKEMVNTAIENADNKTQKRLK